MEDNTLNAPTDAVQVESQPQQASDLVQADSSPEIIANQQQVEQEIAQEAPQKLKRLDSIDADRIKNLEKNGLSKAQAEMFIINEEKRKMQLKEQQAQEAEAQQESELTSNLQKLDEEKANIQQAIQDAESVGIDASNLRSRLEEIDSEKQQMMSSQGFKPFPAQELEGASFTNGRFEEPQNPNAPADRQDVLEANANANQVTQQEVDERAEAIKREHVQMQAEQQVANDEIAKQRKLVQEAQDKLAQEDLELSQVDPERFWKNKSMGQKILATIGMMLGGAPAVRIVQEQINQDINAQNLTNKQKLAKRAQAIKLVNTQIDRLSALTNDRFKQEKLQLSKQQLGIQLEKINTERLKLAQAELQKRNIQNELSQGKLKDTSNLNKDDRERAVRMRDGSIQLADNKKASEDVRKFQAEVEPAIKGAHRILKVSEQGSRLNLKDRARIATDLKALVGQLRIPFTGPGVLTDTEYERLLDTIGDPNKLFAIPEIERVKIKTVINKLTSDLDTRYEQAGLKGVKSKREKLIDLKMQQKAGSREQIEKTIDSLIQQGKLSQDYEAGF